MSAREEIKASIERAKQERAGTRSDHLQTLYEGYMLGLRRALAVLDDDEPPRAFGESTPK